jgi:beta-barrel assembly-enhancing protease
LIPSIGYTILVLHRIVNDGHAKVFYSCKLCEADNFYKFLKESRSLIGLIIIVILLYLLFNPNQLPGLGTRLGEQSRKPIRQAKWIWSSFTGTEAETIRAERDYGQECARAFAAQFPGTVPPEDQALVEGIGARLADAIKDPRRKLVFSVVASAQANAFALPGGFLYITGSLLDVCERDGNAIAFFLSHEIGHVLRGHARDRMTADALLRAVASRLPKAGLMLHQIAGKGYSRIQELEADQEAVRIAAAAGFDRSASISAMKRLAKVAPDPSGLAEYFSSHPPFAERIRELEKDI